MWVARLAATCLLVQPTFGRTVDDNNVMLQYHKSVHAASGAQNDFNEVQRLVRAQATALLQDMPFVASPAVGRIANFTSHVFVRYLEQLSPSVESVQALDRLFKGFSTVTGMRDLVSLIREAPRSDTVLATMAHQANFFDFFDLLLQESGTLADAFVPGQGIGAASALLAAHMTFYGKEMLDLGKPAECAVEQVVQAVRDGATNSFPKAVRAVARSAKSCLPPGRMHEKSSSIFISLDSALGQGNDLSDLRHALEKVADEPGLPSTSKNIMLEAAGIIGGESEDKGRAFVHALATIVNKTAELDDGVPSSLQDLIAEMDRRAQWELSPLGTPLQLLGLCARSVGNRERMDKLSEMTGLPRPAINLAYKVSHLAVGSGTPAWTATSFWKDAVSMFSRRTGRLGWRDLSQVLAGIADVLEHNLKDGSVEAYPVLSRKIADSLIELTARHAQFASVPSSLVDAFAILVHKMANWMSAEIFGHPVDQVLMEQEFPKALPKDFLDLFSMHPEMQALIRYVLKAIPSTQQDLPSQQDLAAVLHLIGKVFMAEPELKSHPVAGLMEVISKHISGGTWAGLDPLELVSRAVGEEAPEGQQLKELRTGVDDFVSLMRVGDEDGDNGPRPGKRLMTSVDTSHIRLIKWMHLLSAFKVFTILDMSILPITFLIGFCSGEEKAGWPFTRAYAFASEDVLTELGWRCLTGNPRIASVKGCPAFENFPSDVYFTSLSSVGYWILYHAGGMIPDFGDKHKSACRSAAVKLVSVHMSRFFLDLIAGLWDTFKEKSLLSQVYPEHTRRILALIAYWVQLGARGLKVGEHATKTCIACSEQPWAQRVSSLSTEDSPTQVATGKLTRFAKNKFVRVVHGLLDIGAGVLNLILMYKNTSFIPPNIRTSLWYSSLPIALFDSVYAWDAANELVSGSSTNFYTGGVGNSYIRFVNLVSHVSAFLEQYFRHWYWGLNTTFDADEYKSMQVAKSMELASQVTAITTIVEGFSNFIYGVYFVWEFLKVKCAEAAGTANIGEACAKSFQKETGDQSDKRCFIDETYDKDNMASLWKADAMEGLDVPKGPGERPHMWNAAEIQKCMHLHDLEDECTLKKKCPENSELKNRDKKCLEGNQIWLNWRTACNDAYLKRSGSAYRMAARVMSMDREMTDVATALF